MVSASLALKPKKDASNKSMSSKTAPAFTKFGSFNNSGSAPAAISFSSEKNETPSTPSRKFRQNSSKFLAFGNRPFMPIMATFSGALAETLIIFRYPHPPLHPAGGLELQYGCDPGSFQRD